MTKWFKTSVIVFGIGVGVGVITCVIRIFSRKKEEDIVSKVSNRTSRGLKIPKHTVGLVLGRGGATIKDIRQKTKAKITFEDIDNDYTVATIIGFPCEVEEAINLINKIITGRSIMATKELFIPNKYSDSLIGRNGDNIRCICHESRAKITIDWTPTKDSMSSLKVIIKGKKEEVDTAIEIIDKIVAEAEVNASSSVHVAGRALPENPLPVNLSNSVSQNMPCEKFIANSSDGYLEVYISAVESPSKFFVQISGAKSIQLDKLAIEMSEFYNDDRNRIKFQVKNAKIGDIVTAFYSNDKSWYRARVQNVSDSNNDSETKVDIFYVDFGDYAVLNFNSICKIMPEHLSIPFQAIECNLAEVEPVDGVWSENASDLFAKLVHLAQWKVMMAKQVEKPVRNGEKLIDDPPHFVTLCDTSTNQDINIADVLIEKGFAKRVCG